MTCQEFEPDLGDYIDGTLHDAAAARLETHLHRCAECRAFVTDVRALRAAARSLEPHLPAPHVWPRLAAALEAETSRRSLRRLFGFTMAPLTSVLSATIVLVILAGGIWISWRDVAMATRPSLTSTRSGAPVMSTIEPVEVELQAAERHYTNAIATLEQISKSQATTLDTPTAAIVEANLAVIDRAIGESRQALQGEPSSELAQESLFEALRSKITLLQDTIALVNEMRKGNQDGAARIVSGMNP